MAFQAMAKFWSLMHSDKKYFKMKLGEESFDSWVAGVPNPIRAESHAGIAGSALGPNVDTRSIASDFVRTPSVANFSMMAGATAASTGPRGAGAPLGAAGNGTLTKRLRKKNLKSRDNLFFLGGGFSNPLCLSSSSARHFFRLFFSCPPP
jgi:hypothetical protein